MQSKLSKVEALAIYQKLLLARLCEEKIRGLYPLDEMKTPVHLGNGGEAISIGVSHALPKPSAFFGTYRNHALFLALSGDTDGFFAELYGKASGACAGKGGSMHLMTPEAGLLATSAVVATTIPVAVGTALANQYKGSPQTVAVFFGDGAMEEGVFWESLNFACLHRLKILFVCEDNGLAINTLQHQRQGFRSIPEAVQGFQLHHASNDGSNVLKVIQTTRDILQRMKTDRKPGFLHLSYFRFLEHVGIHEDFKAGFRDPLSSEEARRRDPIQTMANHLLRMKIPKAQLLKIEQQIITQIDLSVKKAKAAPFPKAKELYSNVLT